MSEATSVAYYVASCCCCSRRSAPPGPPGAIGTRTTSTSSSSSCRTSSCAPGQRYRPGPGRASLLVQPYFLLRLVEHFRDVPAVVRADCARCHRHWRRRPPCLFPGRGLHLEHGALRLPRRGSTRMRQSRSRQEARRKAGVTAKRLMFAALGTWLFASVFVVNTGGDLLTERESRRGSGQPASSFRRP